MDKLFAVWCLYEYQSPRSTPTIRRKQRHPTSKLQTPVKSERKKQVKFRLLTEDDVETVRGIYEEGQKDRIIPAFKIGILSFFHLLTMLVIFTILFAITRSFLTCLMAEILYTGAVLAGFYKLFNDHISRSLNSDLAKVKEYYKTQETCTRYRDFAENGSSIWVAVRDNDVMGFVSFRHVDADTIELKRMGVSQKYWRNGVGISLCQFAIQFLQATKYKRIILETTEAHQAAVRLYKKFQFVLVQRQKRSLGLASIHLEHYELPITRVNSKTTESDLTQIAPKNIINNVQ